MKLNDRYVSACFYDCLGKKKEETKSEEPFFIIGNEYSLTGKECDNFTMPTRTYKLVGIVNELYGVKIDSVIMKQITGENHTLIFTLTKYDCKELGIQFEEGLQVFSKKLCWRCVTPKKEKKNKHEHKMLFNPDDLSTYPVDFNTKLVKCICVKISGFIKENKPFEPNQKYEDLLNIKVKQANSRCGEFSYGVITSRITNGEYNIIDGDGNIFLEVDLASVFGKALIPNSLKNITIHDLLEIHI